GEPGAARRLVQLSDVARPLRLPKQGRADVPWQLCRLPSREDSRPLTRGFAPSQATAAAHGNSHTVPPIRSAGGREGSGWFRRVIQSALTLDPIHHARFPFIVRVGYTKQIEAFNPPSAVGKCWPRDRTNRKILRMTTTASGLQVDLLKP